MLFLFKTLNDNRHVLSLSFLSVSIVDDSTVYIKLLTPDRWSYLSDDCLIFRLGYCLASFARPRDTLNHRLRGVRSVRSMTFHQKRRSWRLRCHGTASGADCNPQEMVKVHRSQRKLDDGWPESEEKCEERISTAIMFQTNVMYMKM